jgi:apolipoprotein N-acyltransferase|tara:strand:- start:171 stop:515 length:345 start_codon:yes stop_codon:yes gene_type:complete
MFTGAESATGFLERIGVSSSSIDANHLQMTANLGWIYIVFAIAFVATLLAPIEQSTVFFRMMLVGSFINSIRLIITYMGVDGGANPVPMIASILVFVLMNILYNRSGMRIGVTM